MTGSCTWMIPVLLLALFVSFIQSNPMRCKGMTEFCNHVDVLGKHVMNCPENCNSTGDDSICKCLHLNVRQECGSPDYFINGLKSMHTNISDPISNIRHLIVFLEKFRNCSMNFCPQGPGHNNEPSISPKSFHKKLVDVKDFHNSQQ